MTNTAPGHSIKAAGPLLTAWGAAAGPEGLAGSLLPPDSALPVPAAGADVWERAADRLAAVREQAEARRG
ncbi:hypothetical protein [Nonomuraea sp. NPDC049784]|uniref:hypothetical protein n=1 Tax=Nonomuraea sp. NPDC049784 TaxID=3154361 RepID=UPI0033D0677F